MRSLLSTSALIAPFLIGAALAQDAPATTEPMVPPTTEQTDTLPDTQSDPADATDGGTAPAIDGTAPATDTDATPPADTTVDTVAPDAAPAAAGNGETIMQEQAPNELRVDWITGTNVRSTQDESIGSIADLIIDQETNTITAAILSVGGFLGIGAKQIAVRFDELEIDFDAREIHLNLSREEADAAPEYVFRERTDAPAPPAATDTGGGMGAPVQPLD